MTTYTLQGAAVQFPEDDGPTISVAASTFSFVVPDNTTSLTYTIVDTEEDSLPEVDFNGEIYNVRLDGFTYTQATASSLEFSLGQVNWSGGVTYLLILELDTGPDDLEYIFEIGGAPLPDFSSAAAVDSFIASATFIGEAGGAFAEGATLSLSGLAGVSVSQNDRVIGTTGDDVFAESVGNDTVNLLTNDFGEDVIYDGAGNDTYDYSSSTASAYHALIYSNRPGPINVAIEADQADATITGSGTDTIVDVHNAMAGDGLEISGTSGDDTFNIETNPAEFGYLGLNGGAGNDSYVLEVAGGTTVRINLSYDGLSGATTGAVVNLDTGIISNDGFGGTDTVSVTGDGRLELRGTGFADSILGSARNERFILDAGNDTLDGGGGFDWVRYDRNQIDAVVVNLDTGIATGNWNGSAFTDTLSNIEAVRGSRYGNDSLTGDEFDNRLEGRGGDDTLEGFGGNDTLVGGEGQDTYVINGQVMADLVRIWDEDGGSILRLLDFPGFDAAGFYVDGNDLIRVSDNGQTTIIEDGANQSLFVQWANSDQTIFDPMLTVITDFSDATNSAYVFAGTNDDDTLVAADVTGSVDAEIYLNDGDDMLTADDGYTAFAFMGSGNDTFIGSGADDWVRGQGGADSLSGGAGNDTLRGEDGTDTIDGGAGNDMIFASGGGADVIDGGDGTDTLIYDSDEGRVLVDLQADVSGAAFARFFTAGAGEGQTFANIENVRGGALADNLRGDSGDNLLEGGGVSDRLYGRAGDDTLMGGSGADALYGNLGVDVMTGGDDLGRRDRFIYFQTEESGVGEGNRDIITDFRAGEDRIELSRFDADTTLGNKQAFTFVGGAGLSGTAGELAYVHEGGNTIVQADFDGDGVADFEIELTGIMGLAADDFLI